MKYASEIRTITYTLVNFTPWYLTPAKFTLCGLATSGLTLGAGKMTERVETSPNLIWSFEDKAKLPNLLDKKEFN
jgi:hypothetical protein